jgi:hypothetical protein
MDIFSALGSKYTNVSYFCAAVWKGQDIMVQLLYFKHGHMIRVGGGLSHKVLSQENLVTKNLHTYTL